MEDLRTSSTSTLSTGPDHSSTRQFSKKRLSRKAQKEVKKRKAIASSTQSTSTSIPVENFFATYEPIAVPTEPSREILESSVQKSSSKNKTLSAHYDEGGASLPKGTLGKWFPNALLIKCPVNYANTGKLLLTNADANEDEVKVEAPRASLVLFYQYTHSAAGNEWTPSQVQLLMTFLSTVARRRNLGGRIRVSTEGVNATVSAVDLPGVTAREALRHFALDLKNFDSKVFTSTDFKYIDDLTPDRHFKELKIIPVQELVFYDIREGEAPLDPGFSQTGEKPSGGVHLDAKEYHEMLKKKDAVVIDVRNHYETIVGRFDGQEAVGGANYIDPKMRKSTDFKGWLEQEETKEKLKDKTVLMFCTGGIRCERASAYLKNKLSGQVGEVYQLKGGIERYLQAYPEGGGFWTGKNKVFDKRESVSASNPNGDGGVVKKAKNGDQEKPTSKCCVCGSLWDRYIGKKKCSTCGVPVLMCDKCLSKAPDKKPNMILSTRCPLCVEEGVTVPVTDVEFTANGIKNKSQTTDQSNQAASVLKWGGGHATQKKLNRKMKRMLCRFGTDCVRSDCLFAHPERDGKSEKRMKAS